ncbi:Glutamine-dependent NAD(+) synthetase [Frankliniella fusca]|uniref:Glutamine-dependent NAD(+) synthetase n=1 Tax=Frankliniella fusca TaxID=407009 RepID=A0AAE1HK82_9NEOP|nr:Glutamine-dependent NAD(+) synthetase [Frankliniella fusca]
MVRVPETIISPSGQGFFSLDRATATPSFNKQYNGQDTLVNSRWFIHLKKIDDRIQLQNQGTQWC